MGLRRSPYQAPPTGLIPSVLGTDSECRFYLFLRDTFGNDSPIYTTHFTLQQENTEERILSVSNFSITTSGATSTATFTADHDFAGYRWLVQPSSYAPVTRRLMAAGRTSEGTPAPDGHSGTQFTAVPQGESATLSLTNLEVGLSYTLYLTAWVGAGFLVSDGAIASNDWLPVQSLTFLAGAPFLTIDSVAVDNDAGEASVSFTTALPGHYYWVAQGAVLPALSGDQIYAGLDANGGRPLYWARGDGRCGDGYSPSQRLFC